MFTLEDQLIKNVLELELRNKERFKKIIFITEHQVQGWGEEK